MIKRYDIVRKAFDGIDPDSKRIAFISTSDGVKIGEVEQMCPSTDVSELETAARIVAETKIITCSCSMFAATCKGCKAARKILEMTGGVE